MTDNVGFHDFISHKTSYSLSQDVSLLSKKSFNRNLGISILLIGNAITAFIILRNLPSKNKKYCILTRLLSCSPVILLANAIALRCLLAPCYQDPQIHHKIFSSATEKIEKLLDNSNHTKLTENDIEAIMLQPEIEKICDYATTTKKTFVEQKKANQHFSCCFVMWTINRYLEKKDLDNPPYIPLYYERYNLKVLALHCIQNFYLSCPGKPSDNYLYDQTYGILHPKLYQFIQCAHPMPFFFSSIILSSNNIIFDHDASNIPQDIMGTPLHSIYDCFNGHDFPTYPSLNNLDNKYPDKLFDFHQHLEESDFLNMIHYDPLYAAIVPRIIKDSDQCIHYILLYLYRIGLTCADDFYDKGIIKSKLNEQGEKVPDIPSNPSERNTHAHEVIANLVSYIKNFK